MSMLYHVIAGRIVAFLLVWSIVCEKSKPLPGAYAERVFMVELAICYRGPAVKGKRASFYGPAFLSFYLKT